MKWRMTVIGAVSALALACVPQPGPLNQADQAMKRHDWPTAVLYLDEYIYDHPNGKHIEQVMFLRGECYFQFKEYYRAANSWVTYIEKYPHGRYAPDVLYRFEILMERKRAQVKQVEAFRNIALDKLKAAQARLDANPSDCEGLWDMANARWDLAEYDEAAKYYVDAISCNESFAMRAEAQNRLRYYPDRVGTVMDGRPKYGVVVTQTYKYPKLVYGSGVETFNRYEVITGKVKNTSARRARGTQVIITAYDFFNKVLDSRVVNVGDLLPLQERAFTATFETGLGIFQDTTINRFEVEPFYELDQEPFQPSGS